MKRREFLHQSVTACALLGFSINACSARPEKPLSKISDYKELVTELLIEWTDSLLAAQIDQLEDPKVHGALYCSACDKIHGRCMDAVYPFMYMADKTGEEQYLDAAISVMDWSENVSRPDGSWTVIPDPKSWRGITVFGAIALGEALYHHGHILPLDIKQKWMDRLAKAADFIYQNFTMTYSHVNYPFTAIYALNFLGRMLENPDYIKRSKELANEVPNWLTKPNKLIFGEDKPADKRSAKGMFAVDLGYNVEESLNGLVQYAVLQKDEALLQLLEESMKGHLEFMLPDGAWDNSWGTRQNKWTYWGSRTTDGCQPAFSLMAERNSAFATAAYINTELLQRCTVDGLLAGGLHYDSHEVKPCIHHTFTHAKSLTYLLDNVKRLSEITKTHPLPRSTADGVKHFPEIDVWLMSRGPWKATVSSYDNEFKTRYSQQATGGSLAAVWHQKLGPVFLASMADYIIVEKNNQQLQPDGEDIPLTPRLEYFKGDQYFTNLYDLKAMVTVRDDDETIDLIANTQLTDRNRIVLPDNAFQLRYILDREKLVIKATDIGERNIPGAHLVLPLISPTGEQVNQLNENKIEVQKQAGNITIEANVPIFIKKTKRERVFNMVPGCEAIPIIARFSDLHKELVCKVKVGT